MHKSVLFIVQFVLKLGNREILIKMHNYSFCTFQYLVFLQLNNMTSQSNHLKVLTNIYCSYSLARLLCSAGQVNLEPLKSC